MQHTILVTGGTGYIGSHTCVELLKAGYNIVIADDLSNSEYFIVERIKHITGKPVLFFNADITDRAATRKAFAEHRIDAVIHFAAYKSVGESAKEPLKYFHNNLYSLVNLLEVMQEYNVHDMVFSSSATVYGDPDHLPVTEATTFKKALSAYGSTKQMGEEILAKAAATGKINAVALRYFNPVGAHASALIGELPKGIPNNLFPYVMQVAAGKLDKLTVFGNDYNTPDGSCIRDYIHVVDLAKAHVLACKRLIEKQNTHSFEVFNLGTGKGTSVLEIINAFEKITGQKLNYTIGKKREGDAAVIYADASKAAKLLQWKAQLQLDEMIRSAWAWEKQL
ncbi:MAG: UDP-glucose 4-epimerase GalE [Ferruginibacter sp.]